MTDHAWDGRERRLGAVHAQCPFTRDEWRGMVGDLRADIRTQTEAQRSEFSALRAELRAELRETRSALAGLDARLRTVEAAVAASGADAGHIEGIEDRLRLIEQSVAALTTRVTMAGAGVGAVVSLVVSVAAAWIGGR